MQTINIDLERKSVLPLVCMKQRDVGAKILINAVKNGVAFEIPQDASFSVWFSGASGDGNYTDIDGKSAFAVQESSITVEFIYQMLNCPGEHVMCLVMNDASGKQTGLWNIPYYVEAIPGADSEGAKQYYQAFLNAQEAAEKAAERAESVAAGNSLLFVPQALTDEQQTQSRENIGAASVGELDVIRGHIGQISETQIIEPSTNKYNSAEWVTGKWMGVNGQEGNNTAFGHTGFIPVSPGDTVIFGAHDAINGVWVSYSMAFVTAYDSNKAAVSSAGANGTYKKSYTVPDGIAYIIISLDATNPNNKPSQINCTTDGVALPYEPYYEGGTTLYPYGYAETQRKIKDAQADIAKLESKIGVDTTSVNGHILSSTFDMTSGTVVNLGEDIRLNRYNVHEFFCKFDTFSSVTVGHGNQVLYGSAVKVDNTKIYIVQNSSVIYEYTHGLTISEFLSVVITINGKGQAEVRICTASGDYITPANLLGNNIWGGLAGNVFAKVTQDCYDCKFVWNMTALLKDVYLFGDSYVPLHDPAQYTTYLANQGYDNFMICGTPGANAAGGLTQFQRIMAVKHPKLVVWALGMNNPDTTAAASPSWLECTQAVIDYCSAHGIELVLATIPNVPERINTHKNEWVRNSGHRYVDFAKAVGAEETGSSWYAGMLKADNVHPDVLGAKALAFRFLLDVPEIANN